MPEENENKPDASRTPTPKLAYSMQEAADAIGVSYITMWRLLKRGKIRASTACRTKIIPAAELHRFLRDSLEAA
jgi:excisionase family DNA binding protein